MEFLKQSFFKIVSKGFNLIASKIPLQKLMYFQKLRILNNLFLEDLNTRSFKVPYSDSDSWEF